MALAHKNPHDRDAHIRFEEVTHTYSVKGLSTGYISVTKLLHCFFPEFDADKIIANMRASANWETSRYFGMSDMDIKKQWKDNGASSSKAGTDLHASIERFLENGSVPERTVEWNYFETFWTKMKPVLEPYRVEWPVYVEEFKVAGCIDAVFRRPSDGAFFIYDWKRSKDIKTENRFETGFGPLSHIPNTNYWQYTVQLNLYRWILENYYDIPITDMYLVILHPDNKSYIRHRLHRLDDEINEIWKARLDAIQQNSRNVVIY